MTLQPMPTVPGVLAGEVPGVESGRLLVMLPPPRDRLTLWVVGADLVSVEIDAAGLADLLALLSEAAGVMRQPAG